MGSDPVQIPTATLNTGAKIPVIGLGTWKAKGGIVGESVEHAIRAGYRHIDCAAAYGNQDEIGVAFEKIFKDGVVKREDLWITSKLWNSDHAAERVPQALKETLKDLKLSYLDEYLMHWPVTGNKGDKVDPPIEETWRALEKVHKEGLAKAIGVSNFTSKKLEALLSYADVTPAVNQIEVHPYFRNEKTIDFCRSKGIHVTAYSPLGSPDSADEVKREESRSILQDPEVKRIADKMDKSPAQILIRWAIQHGTSVIPKATSETHIKGNLDVLNWELSKEDYDTLNSLKYQKRMVDGTMFMSSEGPYRTAEDMWDDEAHLEATE